MLRCTQVPSRLQSHIEDLEDEREGLRNSIILGFTLDGNHLLGFSPCLPYDDPQSEDDASDPFGGAPKFTLQLWSYQLGSPSRLLWNVPLFASGEAPKRGLGPKLAAGFRCYSE